MAAPINIVDYLNPRSDWPLRRKLTWFAAYCAIFACAGLMILPRAW